MKSIYMVKTYYPHWGKHTAFNAFGGYFDRRKFKIKMRNVPMGDEKFRLPFVKGYWRRRTAENRVQEYKLNDLWTEMSLFAGSVFKKIDIIHLLDAEHTLMFLPGWFKKFRHLKKFPKIIAMFHQPPQVLEPIINMDIVKQVDSVVVVSPTQAEFFEQFLPPQRIRTILLGVDTGHFKPNSLRRVRTFLKKGSDTSKNFCSAASRQAGQKKFLCLGGGVWLRDYEAIFKTAALLQKEPQIEFHLVAPEKIEHPALGNIFFHENITDAELLELYRSCDILFLPMQDATANTFLLEGCACGLPVVSSGLESIRAYFPGPEAVLVKDNDPALFVETILRLKNNPPELAEMSFHARQRALALSWESIVKEYEDLYMNIGKN